MFENGFCVYMGAQIVRGNEKLAARTAFPEQILECLHDQPQAALGNRFLKSGFRSRT